MSENTPMPDSASAEDAVDAAPPVQTAPEPAPTSGPGPVGGDGEILDAVIVDDPALSPDPSSAGVGPAYPTTVVTPTGYTDAGVPTLDYVQDRIEARIGRALGTAELDQSSEVGRTVEKQATDREQSAKDRLEAIRKSLGS